MRWLLLCIPFFTVLRRIPWTWSKTALEQPLTTLPLPSVLLVVLPCFGDVMSPRCFDHHVVPWACDGHPSACEAVGQSSIKRAVWYWENVAAFFQQWHHASPWTGVVPFLEGRSHTFLLLYNPFNSSTAKSHLLYGKKLYFTHEYMVGCRVFHIFNFIFPSNCLWSDTRTLALPCNVI